MDTNTRKPLEAKEKLAWLRLIRSDNVGPMTFYRLLERFGSADKALAALPDLALKGGRKKIKVCPKAEAEAELEILDTLGVHLVARDDPDYPPLLAQVEDAPPLIQVRGHVHLLSKKSVAIVGARNASISGCKFARSLAHELGEAGLMVVSGMARGIDTAAHEGALAAGTLAVLGGGVDVIYPKENTDLYEDLLARGAVLSEVKPGTQPQARHFPRRNRIISGMARGIVVVEASPKSGSLITARMALEQGREVFAVPGSPLDPRSKGANSLIRDGATLIETADDVVRGLETVLNEPLQERRREDFVASESPLPTEDELAGMRVEIVNKLSITPVSVDEVIRNCQCSPAVVQTLLELELAGRLERGPGNMVSLVLEGDLAIA